MNKFKSILRHSHAKQWISILAVLAISVASVNYKYETQMFLTSVTGVQEHDPFDGTVMPLELTPNWSSLTTAEYSMSYQDIPQSKMQPIPEYRNDYLTYDSSLLKWGNAQDNIIRNTKITFSVGYTGNYKFDDSGEGFGSHPAVDIKAPEGTPVYAVANGIVVKVSSSSSGFGNSIVIKHNGVPDPNSPSQTTTLYSSYNHLKESFVQIQEGVEVYKGEAIGLVGHTGTATASHLHFQLDSADAPWHPYWPFTSAEASAAGYNFWDAVNYKVGMDNVYRYTRNPMTWVQSYLDENAVLTENFSAIPETTTEDPVEDVVPAVETVVTPETTVAEEVEDVLSSVVNIDFSNLQIETPAFIMPGQNQTITVRLLGSDGQIMKDAKFDGQMTVSVSDSNVGKLNKSYLENVDFNSGSTELSLYADYTGTVTVVAEIAGRTYTSSDIFVISAIEPFAKFGVAHDGTFVPGKPETIQIQAQDLTGNPTPSFYGDGSVELSIAEGSGTLSRYTLSKEDFPTGIAEVQFTGDSDESVIIQVTYGTKTVESKTLESNLFNDLSEAHDYYPAVSYLYRKGTVQGYPDGTFKPDNTVSRIEALKFIFSGLDQKVLSGLSANFNDTQNGQWYSDYLATAYSLGVVQGYSDGTFKPTQGVNRVEFLKMVFSIVDISVDPVVIENPYDDVNNLSWYAPYVAYAKEKNIFPISGQNFDPGQAMSRIEVAEVVYRMIAVQENNGEPYNSLMAVE